MIELGLSWGENQNREDDGTSHIEWHAPCGCAFHPKPFPHVHPCSDEHKRPDLHETSAPSIDDAIAKVRAVIDPILGEHQHNCTSSVNASQLWAKIDDACESLRATGKPVSEDGAVAAAREIAAEFARSECAEWIETIIRRYIPVTLAAPSALKSDVAELFDSLKIQHEKRKHPRPVRILRLILYLSAC